jgi:hypothetical protein
LGETSGSPIQFHNNPQQLFKCSGDLICFPLQSIREWNSTNPAALFHLLIELREIFKVGPLPQVFFVTFNVNTNQAHFETFVHFCADISGISNRHDYANVSETHPS